MLKVRYFWYVMMIGAVGGWIFSILGLVRPSENDTMKKIQKSILYTWALGHPLELLVSLGIGKKMGLSLLRTVTKTLLFGFTWWLPLKLGVIKK
ncbi:MAG: hypothetical protein J7L53_09815 [Deltaproteobacteria bacterium]|nr:hypothetical protein [Deltaproteobacteria bacterium]